ncbi:MAG: PEP/pyruvate-binding domain-containing protein [bacterium]
MIKFLHEITTEEVGGKARGLKTLQELGLNVPDAFVIIHPESRLIDETLLKKSLARLGEGPKAVRSSAVSEDGITASFAGQFETFLHLNTFPEIRDAIKKCVSAAKSERVKEYASKVITDADLRISVILQNMVNARVAGVIFSANPVNNRRDKMLINVVEGHGESLVSGQKDAIHYELYRSGSNIASQIRKQGELLTENQLLEILEGAKRAEKHHGMAVDLEFAIDEHGVLNWLQVRPVTTLSEVHFNELDTVKGESTDIWTLGNIGEMMPGIATPLTYSVSAEAIDYGMTVLADSAGAFPLQKRTGPRYIQMFYNRLFINMSNMMDYPKNIWLNKKEDVLFALSTKEVPGIEFEYESPFPFRVINFFRQVTTTTKAGKTLKMLKKLATCFSIDPTGSLTEVHERLGKARFLLGVGFGHHLITSAQSGTLYSAFIRIMTDDKRQPTAEDHHTATVLLRDIPEIESADAVKSLEKFALLIRNSKPFAEKFISASPADALRLLQEEAPVEISRFFVTFLERHGHRCVRESELREKPWEQEPGKLIQILQTKVKIGDFRHTTRDLKKDITEALHHLPLVKRVILKSLIPSSRKGVARREISKAYSIKMVSIVRKAYVAVAARLVGEGLLDDTDQVYFLTHEEIGQLISDHDPKWKTRAGKRRELFPESDKLLFDEVCYGIPEPSEEEPEIIIGEGQLKGTPVSNGAVEARVRIIQSLEDADKLREGEIMVASFTDIGWTPYFSVISGLITEIGSPLSHGAVVAREYGIPAVVGVKGAKKFLKDGDLVRLDGDRGIVERI